MRTISFLLAILFLIQIVYAKQSVHVFWYKAQSNAYDITANPGPGLPKKAVIHQGMIATGQVKSAHNHWSGETHFVLGSNKLDDEGWCSFFWSQDLNDNRLNGSRVDSAFLCGEYADRGYWESGIKYMFCNGGPIKLRIGLVDVSKTRKRTVQDTAIWSDLCPALLNYCISLMDSAQKFMEISAPHGRDSCNSIPRLDKKFARIDVSDQVRYILNSDPDCAIVLLSPAGQQNTGRITLMADETCKNRKPDESKERPNENWSKDANTMHLVVYGDLKR